MKNFIILNFIIIFTNIFGQNKILQVDYVFSHNKSKKDTTKIIEKYCLLINNNKSYYISENKIINDSIKKGLLANNDRSKIMSSNIFSFHTIYESVIKDYTSNEIITYKHIIGNPIGYIEKGDFNWSLSNETKISNGIKLNLATCEFGGRKWFAWYDNTYPINEGPYKFKNLPGLVFEAYDKDNVFRFQLISIKNKKTEYIKDFSMFKILPREKVIEVLNNNIYNPFPEFTKIMTPESKRDFIKRSIEENRKIDYIEKDFE